MSDNLEEQRLWQKQYFSKRRIFLTSRAKAVEALIALSAAIFAGLLAVQAQQQSGVPWVAAGLLVVVLLGAALLLLELGIRHCEVRDARLMMVESVVREEKDPRKRVFDQLLRNNQFLKWGPRFYAVIFILFLLTFFSTIILWINSLTSFSERIIATVSRQLNRKTP